MHSLKKEEERYLKLINYVDEGGAYKFVNRNNHKHIIS